MSAQFSISHFSSCHLHFLIFLVLLHLCLSDQKSDDVLCIDGERQALIQFKHDLIDEADRLASWDGEKNDCCQWAGIVCDNITGHVHEIHLRALDDLYEEGSKQRLRGNLSSSLLELKQLQYLDLSCNDFEGIQIPRFIGSLRNLRYLNLSESNFSGMIPPQIGNLSKLHVLSLGSWYGIFDSAAKLTSMNIQWLSSLHWLHHLDMTHTNLGNANDWFQVINTLPSLGQLHMSRCGLRDSYSHIPSLNVTSLSVLDLSNNEFVNPSFPMWIFSLTNLVSLDLSYCYFDGPLPSTSIYSFGNLTSLRSLHVKENDFMNSPSVIGLPSNLVTLDMSSCGLSSSILDSFHNLTSLLSLDLSDNQLTNSILDSFHNLTSLLSLDLSDNQLTKAILHSLGNLCNIREIDLSSNDFSNISLSCLLQNLFECKSPSLESLTISSSGLSGSIPYSIGRLSSLKYLYLDDNKLNGSIPESIGRLSSLKELELDDNKLNGSIPESIGRLSSLEDLSISLNQLTGNLPISLGQLSKLYNFRFSNNLLTGIVTEAHFVKLMSLKFLFGNHNNLTMKMQAAKWIPPFQIQFLNLNSWTLGPQFPLWLRSQRDLIELDISNTRISSIMPPESFWRSLPNLTYLYMSENNIKGTPILGVPTSLEVLDLSSNDFTGELPSLSSGSLIPVYLNLSNNYLVGSLHHFLCSNGMEEAKALYLGNNGFSGVIPKCWEKWRSLTILNMENNCLSGEIPKTISFIPNLLLLNMRGNKISGIIPTSLMNMTRLQVLQLGGNKLVGSIPSWFGTKLTLLRILNLWSNNLDGNIPHELCHLSSILILNLADNNMSGNIPRCFYNFSVLSGKETTSNSELFIYLEGLGLASASETLVTKGQEYTYKSILGLVRSLDLSNNNLSGDIPSELTTLLGLKFLNLSQNQLTGRIPEKIGDMKDLESFDLSLNKLSGELPMSLSRLTFLSSFNVSHNNLTGRVPTGTQLQGFSESSFFGNKLCGAPLSDCRVQVEVPTQTRKDQKEENGADWGLIISIVLGFFTGFWIIVAPLIVSTSWRIAYYSIMNKLIKVHGF